MSAKAVSVKNIIWQILEAISKIKTEWGATIVVCTTDASGESRKAHRLLQEKFSHLVVPDCVAHQVWQFTLKLI